jgi:alkylation response protein AidB-like acyl-CoA dehydrogenase
MKEAGMKQIPIESDWHSEALTDFLKREVAPKVLDWDEVRVFPPEVVGRLHDLGLMRVGYPQSFGGEGRPMIDLLKIASELAYYSTGVMSTWLATVLTQTAIFRFASPRLAAAVFSEQREKRTVFSFCATEQGTGFDIDAMSTVARRLPDGFAISGRKHYITNINYASHLVVFAKIVSHEHPGKPALSAFLVPANAPGVTVGEPLKKLGQGESNTGTVEFSDVFVPTENLLGEPGMGWNVLSTCISRTKTILSAGAVGICRRAEAEAVGYLAETKRFGEPILNRRDVQAVLSAERVQMEAAWLLACRSAAVWDETGTAVYESSVAKMFAADIAVSFVNEALELMGGTGYMRDSMVSKLHRDVKVFEIFEGSTLVLQSILGRELFAPALKRAKAVKKVDEAA